VAWHGNYAPVKYDLQDLLPGRRDPVRPSRPVDLHRADRALGRAGTANIDFVLFRERWMVAEDTFRPPWYHKNIMSELMGNIYGQYDAKPQGFVPGGMSLHNMMLPHGPDREAFEGASNADLEAPQARQHHVLHVRDPLPAAPDGVRREGGAACRTITSTAGRRWRRSSTGRRARSDETRICRQIRDGKAGFSGAWEDPHDQGFRQRGRHDREDHQLRRDRPGALCLHGRGRPEHRRHHRRRQRDDRRGAGHPRLARKVIDCVRSVTDKPISHLVLTHYHAVRVLGASAYGAGQIIMSDTARAMVAERGQEDWDSEFARFPAPFRRA
jgi:hypothetical protein